MKKRLSKSEIDELNKELKQAYEIIDLFSKKDAVELDENKYSLIYLNKQCCFFKNEDKWIPTLKLLLQRQFLKTITVDMGAVKFIANGADVMRPGIITVEEGITENQVVVIIDVTHKKPLAVGITLFNAETIKKSQSGKMVKTIHYVGDFYWNSQKN